MNARARGDFEMSIQNSVVAVYPAQTEAGQAVKELQRGRVDMHKLSIVGKGYHKDEQAVGYYNTGDRMKYWGKVWAFWGGLWGLLFGSAFFMIPGLGPNLSGRTGSGMDCGRVGRCGGGRSVGCSGSWPLQHRNSQGQYFEVRSSTQERSIPADRPRNGCRGGEGKGHHRNYASRPIVGALSRSESGGNGLALTRFVWATPSRWALPIGVYFRRILSV